MSQSPLFLSYGMGIGPEVSLHAVFSQPWSLPIVLIGRRSSLKSTKDIPIWNPEAPAAVSWFPLEDSDEVAEVRAIRLGAQFCLTAKGSALVTGPIKKKKLVSKGFSFYGHTDFLGHLCGSPRTVMGFVGGVFRVCLATTHIPLMKVGENLSVSGLIASAEIALSALRNEVGIPNPRLGICGLNPHAGEGGVLGREEIDIIEPACNALRKKGHAIVGPISAETAFLMARNKKVDMIMAMYHDQGLAPLKAVDFGQSVNWTLGLPIIRTSVDHGTADSLVGTNTADCGSMISALKWAEFLVKQGN